MNYPFICIQRLVDGMLLEKAYFDKQTFSVTYIASLQAWYGRSSASTVLRDMKSYLKTSFEQGSQ
jgi:hypothetical protein